MSATRSLRVPTWLKSPNNLLQTPATGKPTHHDDFPHSPTTPSPHARTQ
eukprot:CAMPEP_0203882920 /NCGR_PEP_ID=MMETSP0359-20131031/27069_1 /ASSEMBLY_ACC=CAM_ASM_000338 /TAXON_ID=268821 /ORGANISM="Scrippsiella Hangoei, Strain SHTV-5" /LENGTH=48 /DNA_ID= /DNA_START= /DNA_END= /DNA_ORIENTATION=